MRVLLFTNNEFPAGKMRDRTLQWVREYSRFLVNRRYSLHYFHPFETIIESTDLVHIFGTSQQENWYWLKQLSRTVFVSPFPGEETISFEKKMAHSSVNKFFIFSAEKKPNPSEFRYLSLEPAQAAAEMNKIYESYCS